MEALAALLLLTITAMFAGLPLFIAVCSVLCSFLAVDLRQQHHKKFAEKHLTAEQARSSEAGLRLARRLCLHLPREMDQCLAAGAAFMQVAFASWFGLLGFRLFDSAVAEVPPARVQAWAECHL